MHWLIYFYSAEFDPGPAHTFVEIGHEIISTVIFFLPPIQEWLFQLQAKYVHEVLVNHLDKNCG